MVEEVKFIDQGMSMEVEQIGKFYENILIALDLPMANSMQEANGLITQYMDSHPEFDISEAIH